MKWIIPVLLPALFVLPPAPSCTLADATPDSMTVGYGHTWFGGTETDFGGSSRIVTDHDGNDIVYVSVSYKFGESELPMYGAGYGQHGRPGWPSPQNLVESGLERLPVPGRPFGSTDTGPQDPDPVESRTEPQGKEAVEGVESDATPEEVPSAEEEFLLDPESVKETIGWFDRLGMTTQLSILAVILAVLVVCRKQIGVALGKVFSRFLGRNGGSGSEK